MLFAKDVLRARMRVDEMTHNRQTPAFKGGLQGVTNTKED